MSEVAENTDTLPSPTKPRKITKPRKLTLKQKAFVDAYIDPESKTYSNGTQSALRAYNTQDRDTAAHIAQDTLIIPHVQSYIEQVTRDINIGIEERLIRLAGIAKGTHKRHTVSTQHDRDGNVISKTVVEKDTSDSDSLHAIDLINRTDGTYVRTNVQEHVAKRAYDERMKDLREAMHKRLQARNVSATTTSE